MRSAVPPLLRRALGAPQDGRSPHVSALLALVAAVFFAVPTGTAAPALTGFTQRAGAPGVAPGKDSVGAPRSSALATRHAPGAPVMAGERTGGRLIQPEPAAVSAPLAVVPRSALGWPVTARAGSAHGTAGATERGRGPPGR
jgi:hypothetical protein